jgi:polysaccharide export outer membrane protein
VKKPKTGNLRYKERAVKQAAVRGDRLLVLFAVGASLVGCGLPRPGPSKRELFSSSVERKGDAFVVSVNDRVTQATAVVPALGFSDRKSVV